jgi:deazaflavin-dependent oxidoreductase (nitroreductase family)
VVATPASIHGDLNVTEATRGVQDWLARWASEPYAYLTTTGRRTGRGHRIEIWFAANGGRLYLLSGGRDRSDWVRNIQANPHVTVELGEESRVGEARILQAGTAEDGLARDLLVEKYATPGNPLTDWKRRSLPVVIEFSASGDPPPSRADEEDAPA